MEAFMKKSLLFAIITVLFGVYWLRSEPQGDDIAFNRFWLSHLPQHERDKFSLIAFINDDKVGVFQESSAFQGNYDIFTSSGNNGTVTINMLQDGKKVNATYTASKCEVKNFDYCLEIKGAPRGPVRYYSQKDWVIDSTVEAQTLAQKIATHAE
jgi:hypothetical protein